MIFAAGLCVELEVGREVRVSVLWSVVKVAFVGILEERVIEVVEKVAVEVKLVWRVLAVAADLGVELGETVGIELREAVVKVAFEGIVEERGIEVVEKFAAEVGLVFPFTENEVWKSWGVVEDASFWNIWHWLFPHFQYLCGQRSILI